MADKLVSIIIPVYNAEDSIHRCMDSILNQTYKPLEIILINDGSTDQSGEICDRYGEMDRRIKVIHQKNHGPSHARNKGIHIATGTHIQFIDADDYIEKQMTKTLVTAVTAHEQLIMCGYQTVSTHNNYQTINHYIPSIRGIYQNEDFMAYFGELYKDVLIPSPCNKLYDARLIHKENIRFTEDMNYGEDLLFNLDYIRVCLSVQIIPDQLYNYLITNNRSLSRNFNENLRKKQDILHDKVKSLLLEKNAYTGRNRHLMNTMYANHTLRALNNLFHSNSTYTPKQKKAQIESIINDVQQQEKLNYFKDSLLARILGQMITYDLTSAIYYLFYVKNILQTKLQHLFR